jgi:predicted Zn-dependent protease
VSRCDADGLVCLAPLGQVPTALVRHLVSHYQTQYGLDVLVLTPIAIPETLVDANRDQVDAVELMSFMRRRFNPYYESEGNIIGVTAVDMYSRQQPNWRYAFGQLGIEEGVVSIVRMDPTNYGAPDAETLDARVRTLVSKYIGILHYGLSPSSDPNSPMYNNILGPSDLDRMMGPLPVFD